MQIQLYIETLPRNYTYLGKAIRTTYSECVSVVSAIQHATHIHPIVFFICVPSGSTIFFYIFL